MNGTRAIMAAVCLLPAAALLAGCARTDYIYDYEGNVVSTPVPAGKARPSGRHAPHQHPPAAHHAAAPAAARDAKSP